MYMCGWGRPDRKTSIAEDVSVSQNVVMIVI